VVVEIEGSPFDDGLYSEGLGSYTATGNSATFDFDGRQVTASVSGNTLTVNLPSEGDGPESITFTKETSAVTTTAFVGTWAYEGEPNEGVTETQILVINATTWALVIHAEGTYQSEPVDVLFAMGLESYTATGDSAAFDFDGQEVTASVSGNTLTANLPSEGGGTDPITFTKQ
jgi:hypothetical protein